MPDGSREFKCQAPLWKCLNYVDDLCKGASFEVLYARDNQHVFGTDQNHVEGHTSEAQVHCLGPNDHYKAAAAGASGSAAASSAVAPAAPVATSVAPPAPKPAPARVCVPGATQGCVGVAACAGGQACLADGSGFGPCDCGK